MIIGNNIETRVNAIDNDGTTALMEASDKGHVEVVKFLVESGADVNIQNNKGTTALTSASLNDQIEVVNYLRSLTTSVFQSTPSDTDFCCPICRDGDGNVATLKCYHTFHTECITKWCNRVASCPMCRTSID